jgi:AraC family transcriptional regulator
MAREVTGATSELRARLLRGWVHRAMSLLDTAIGELHGDDHPAKRTVLQAASLLREQIDPQAVAAAADARGRLLAWQARKVREYIDAHITDRLLVAELGMLVGQSEAHFSRAFKRTFGEPPHAFVIRRRLEFAADYMVQTDASLSAIALRCGFADQPHLCRAFRQATGLSPAVWRRTRSTHDQGDNLVTPASENLKERRRVA